MRLSTRRLSGIVSNGRFRGREELTRARPRRGQTKQPRATRGIVKFRGWKKVRRLEVA